MQLQIQNKIILPDQAYTYTELAGNLALKNAVTGAFVGLEVEFGPSAKRN